jgi:hypothetical protein
MNNNGPSRNNILVGILCFVAFILLFVMLGFGLYKSEMTIKLPLLVIIGVMALFTTLALVAVTFSVAGLSDPSQALGLPEGSVRAAIALALIVIFSITAIFFYNSLASRVDPATPLPSDDFAKQVFTIVGTLMTAVVSFYFATRSATTTAATPVSTPELTSVTPTQAAKAATPVPVPVKISGTDLQLAKTVKLEMGSGNAVLATDVSSSDEFIKCDVTIDPGLAPGKYDVVVTTTDGQAVKLPAAFEVSAAG